MFNLNDYLPKQPNDEELRVIGEMFEASVNGEMYDSERWGNFYRPAGVQIDTSNSAPKGEGATVTSTAPAPAPTPQPAPVAEAAPAPVTPPEKQEQVAAAVAATAPAVEGAKPNAQDILAAIRNRSN